MGEGMEGPACRLRLSPKEADSMEEAHSRFGWRPGAVARGRARQVFDYPLLAQGWRTRCLARPSGDESEGRSSCWKLIGRPRPMWGIDGRSLSDGWG